MLSEIIAGRRTFACALETRQTSKAKVKTGLRFREFMANSPAELICQVKSEIRSTKSERSPKPDPRVPLKWSLVGFRTSSFGFPLTLLDWHATTKPPQRPGKQSSATRRSSAVQTPVEYRVPSPGR